MSGASPSWWRRPLGRRDQSSPLEGTGSRPADADTPLSRARLAAESLRLARELAELERSDAPPDAIAELRSALISLRADLCSCNVH